MIFPGLPFACRICRYLPPPPPEDQTDDSPQIIHRLLLLRHNPLDKRSRTNAKPLRINRDPRILLAASTGNHGGGARHGTRTAVLWYNEKHSLDESYRVCVGVFVVQLQPSLLDRPGVQGRMDGGIPGFQFHLGSLERGVVSGQ